MQVENMLIHQGVLGDVIVPTTGDFVVEVMGSRTVAHYANAYGNNDVFAGLTDDFTTCIIY